MEFNELKSNWKKSEGPSKSQSELNMMTSLKNNPKLKRIRLKLIIESTILTLFLFSFYSVFDGYNKPIWLNIILGFSILLFIINGISGYYILQNPIKGINLKVSVKTFSDRLKTLSFMSIVSSLFFGVSLILYLTETVSFTQKKYLLLIGMSITLLTAIYLSYKNWSYRISRFKSMMDGFNDDI